MAVNWDVHPDMLAQWPELEAALLAEGLEGRVRSARRTCAEQAEQYAIGRSGAGDTRKTVTQARGCQSWHVSGRALDVDLYRGGKKVWQESDYEIMGRLAKERGWKWGGDFPGFRDLGHVEWHPGLTIEQNCPNPDACHDVTYVGTEEPPSAEGGGGEEEDPAGMTTSSKIAIGVGVAGVLWAGWQWYKGRT
jgi:hypothetical protein